MTVFPPNSGGHRGPPLHPGQCRGGPPRPPGFAQPTISRFFAVFQTFLERLAFILRLRNGWYRSRSLIVSNPGDKREPRSQNGRLGFDELEDLRFGLLKYSLILTRNREEAEDLVQWAFEQAMQADVEMIRYPLAWLKRVLRNRFIDERRKTNAHSRCTEQISSQTSTVSSGDVPLDCRLDLTAALRKLPPHLSQALMLVVVERCTYAEAAMIQGVAEGTMKSRVARARKKLSDELSGPKTRFAKGRRCNHD